MTYGIAVGIKDQFVTKLTDVNSTDLDGVGNIRFDELGNIYRYVKNVDTTAFTAKQPVCYDGTANTGAADFVDEVTRPVTTELMVAAGIAITAIGASGGDMYGYVLVYGLSKDTLVLTPATGGTAIAIGSQIVPVDVQTYLGYATAAGTAVTYSNHFVALEAIATATGAAVATIDVMVKCL